MPTLLLILHVLVCLALIAIVLIQGGKGADIGAVFGAGASQTVFGASGGQSFMGKLTSGVAIVFMLTSLLLAYFYASPGSSSIMPQTVEQAAPAAPAAPAPAPAENTQPTGEGR